jgi:hypothetical protein
MKISRVLHAGYIFEDNETKIIFDPIFENPFSVNCYAYPPVGFDTEAIRKVKFAAVFISHFHDDHCSFESLNLIDRKTPIYIYCIHDDLFELVRRLGFENVRTLEIDEPVKINSFKVIPRRAFDSEVDCILQIKASGLNVLNVVDSLLDPDTLQILRENGPYDLVLWPFQTLRETAVLSPSRFINDSGEFPSEWEEELLALNPKFLVPSSCQFIHEPWSWYNNFLFPITYRQFEKFAKTVLPKTQIVRIGPSQSFLLTPNSFTSDSPLPWMRAEGNQDVDYTYDPSRIAPSTASIARHFPKLTREQTDRVISFCKNELPLRFAKLEYSSYFETTRKWQLSLFDHDGKETKFFFKVHQNKLELLNEAQGPEWSTEVPINKVYSALELGETLTSMYIRVAALEEINPMEDPLIRSLFEDRFGAYQRAQLMLLGL